MKIAQAEFRRLHWKSRALDRVCRILWPDANPDEEWDAETIEHVAEAIGDYRPGPSMRPGSMLNPPDDETYLERCTRLGIELSTPLTK